MKFLTILKSFFRSSRFGRVLTAIELLVGLTILFYYADRIIMFRQTTVYYEQFSNLAVYPDDNDAAAAYVEANGTALGKTYSVDLVDDEGLSISNRQAVLGSQAFYRAVPLELLRENGLRRIRLRILLQLYHTLSGMISRAAVSKQSIIVIGA